MTINEPEAVSVIGWVTAQEVGLCKEERGEDRNIVEAGLFWQAVMYVWQMARKNLTWIFTDNTGRSREARSCDVDL